MYNYNILAKTYLDHLRKSNTEKERFQVFPTQTFLMKTSSHLSVDIRQCQQIWQLHTALKFKVYRLDAVPKIMKCSFEAGQTAVTCHDSS